MGISNVDALKDRDNRPACPECNQSKHQNCNGIAWDEVNDEAIPCICALAGHQL